MQKIRMGINDNPGGGSAFNDTGPELYGAIQQLRWSPLQADTGADIALNLLVNPGDTGANLLFLNDNDVLATSFTRAIRQLTQNSSGVTYDTGGSVVPIYANGEKLRITVTPGDTGHIEGNLYIWTEEAS